jgi:hypothetical protein
LGAGEREQAPFQLLSALGDEWGDALKGSGTTRATRGKRGVHAAVVSRSRQK